MGRGERMTISLKAQALDPAPRFDDVYIQGVKNMDEPLADMGARIWNEDKTSGVATGANNPEPPADKIEAIDDEELRLRIASLVGCYYFHDNEDIYRSEKTSEQILDLVAKAGYRR